LPGALQRNVLRSALRAGVNEFKKAVAAEIQISTPPQYRRIRQRRNLAVGVTRYRRGQTTMTGFLRYRSAPRANKLAMEYGDAPFYWVWVEYGRNTGGFDKRGRRIGAMPGVRTGPMQRAFPGAVDGATRAFMAKARERLPIALEKARQGRTG
jgi:hypothetical protein